MWQPFCCDCTYKCLKTCDGLIRAYETMISWEMLQAASEAKRATERIARRHIQRHVESADHLHNSYNSKKTCLEACPLPGQLLASLQELLEVHQIRVALAVAALQQILEAKLVELLPEGLD